MVWQSLTEAHVLVVVLGEAMPYLGGVNEVSGCASYPLLSFWAYIKC